MPAHHVSIACLAFGRDSGGNGDGNGAAATATALAAARGGGTLPAEAAAPTTSSTLGGGKRVDDPVAASPLLFSGAWDATLSCWQPGDTRGARPGSVARAAYARPGELHDSRGRILCCAAAVCADPEEVHTTGRGLFFSK